MNIHEAYGRMRGAITDESRRRALIHYLQNHPIPDLAAKTILAVAADTAEFWYPPKEDDVKRKREQNTPFRYTLVFGLGTMSAAFGLAAYYLFVSDMWLLSGLCGFVSIFYAFMTHFTLDRFTS